MQSSIMERLAAAIHELEMRATHSQDYDVIDVIKEARDHIAKMGAEREEFSSRITMLENSMSEVVNRVVNREEALADARGTLRRVAEALSERFCPHHGLGTCS